MAVPIAENHIRFARSSEKIVASERRNARKIDHFAFGFFLLRIATSIKAHMVDHANTVVHSPKRLCRSLSWGGGIVRCEW